MKRLIFGVVVCVLALVLGAQAWADKGKRNKKSVVLISVDGLRPEFYLDSKYKASIMQRLKASGAYAEAVAPVYPSLTYPNHTTMITGVMTAKHGILSNSLMLPEGPSPAWYWEAEHIKSPTLFEMAKAAGLTTASVRWPVTLKDQAITYNVPEIFGMTGFYEGDGFDLTVKFTEPALMQDILAHTTLKRYDDEVQMDFWVAEATAHLIKSRNPQFTAVHLANVDHVEHGVGREGPEVIAAVEEVDKNIGLILNAVDLERTCVIITGDHGFLDISQKISPNVLFKSKNWLSTDKTGKVSWEVIAQNSGAQAAIYVKNRMLIPQVEQFLRENAHLGYEVVSRAELDALGAYPNAALAISGKPGFTISGSSSGAVVAPSGNLKGNHGFLPNHPHIQTGMLAVGCGQDGGKNLGKLGLVDVAPTVAKVLGLKTGRVDFDGRALKFK